MYNGGGASNGRAHWQNANNPNMAPLPPRPGRPGIGAGPGGTVGGPNGPPPQPGPSFPMGMAQGPPPGYGMGVGRPPPGPMGPGGPPPTGGPPLPGSSGQLPAGPMPSSAGGIPAHTTLFVGNISLGVSDSWLQQLLEACGQLRSLKRVNKSFGFAEYADPDSVLRALAVLSGQELPSQGLQHADNPSAKKTLNVKADEKTRKFLDQYEQGRTKSENDDNMEQAARKSVEAIITQMEDPTNAQTTTEKPAYDVPSHLKDLPPEELPEEHRGSVLSEIDKFRQASAAREEEKKRKERVQEMERQRARQEAGRQAHASNTRGPGPPTGPSAMDKQSYLRPVGFVGASDQEDEKNLPADERDEKEEQRRKEREREEAARNASESERRYLAHERQRMQHWERELSKERAEEDRRSKEAAALGKLLSGWDQSREEERDMFYVDRSRWRHLRKGPRERELEEDEQDRKAEEADEEAARLEAEKFLAQQAAEMAQLAEQQRAAGILVPGANTHAPLKLKVAPDAAAGSTQTNQVPTTSSGVLGEAEDEDDRSKRRGRLAKIELSDGLSDSQRFRKNQQSRDKIEADLPRDEKELFSLVPQWEWVDEEAIEERYRPLLDQGIIDSVGEAVPDMVEELVKHLRSQKKPRELINVIEPVLEEEAPPLVAKLWKAILVDTLSAAAGV